MANWELIRKRSAKTAKRLFDDFDRKRKNILLDVAREFYPLGVAGLTRRVETLSDECAYDEEHRLLTTIPVNALRKGACGFHGNLTSPARRWFRFRPVDGDASSAQMMDRLTEAVEFTLRATNAYPQIYKMYEHLLWAGFCCAIVSRDPRNIMRLSTLRIGTYAMDVGEDGTVCRVARRFSWTAEQILSRFGAANAPERIKKAASDGNDRVRFTVHNIIEPTATGDLKAYDPVAKSLDLSDEFVYRSVYWLKDARDEDPQSGILEVSGFTVKPIIAPRLDYEAGDVYGRGRGIDGLDKARGLQSEYYDKYNIVGLKGKPPLVVSDEFKDEGFHAGRGGINYASFGQQRAALALPVFAQPPDTTDIRQEIAEDANEIADLFFNSAFATIDALKNNPGVKTATEVDALIRENMERLNPIVTNLDREMLDPLVNAVLRYTLEAQVAPLTEDDVAALANAEQDVEYVSQIHLAAKAGRINALYGWLTRIAQAAQAFPAMLDKVNPDKVVDNWADMLGVPADALADEQSVAATRAERQQAMQMQQRAVAAKTMGDLSRAGAMPVDQQHLGGTLMRGLAGDATQGMT